MNGKEAALSNYLEQRQLLIDKYIKEKSLGEIDEQLHKAIENATKDLFQDFTLKI